MVYQIINVTMVWNTQSSKGNWKYAYVPINVARLMLDAIIKTILMYPLRKIR